MEEQVKAVLETIRPNLQADGGDVEFVSIDGDVVKVRLTGACGGCPMATMTLKNGIERIVMEQPEGISSVESV